MVSLFTGTRPLPFSSLRTWLVTFIQRLPAPQSALTTCQPPPFCARAGVENKQEARSRQSKGRYIMRFFIGGPYPICREIELPRAGPIQRQEYLSLVRFGTVPRLIRDCFADGIVTKREKVAGNVDSIGHPDVGSRMGGIDSTQIVDDCSRVAGPVVEGRPIACTDNEGGSKGSNAVRLLDDFLRIDVEGHGPG